MKLEYQCCNLKQAKLLRSLGIIQKSLFYHHPAFERPVFGNLWVTETGKQYKKVQVCNDKKSAASAFTVAEISQILPDYYPSWRFKKSEQSEDRIWIATVICGPKPEGIDNIRTASEFDRYGKTQAEALAALLISLLETETITTEECNKRLQEAKYKQLWT